MDICDNIDERDCKEKPISVGKISSQFLQYLRNALDFQQPWTITTNGSTLVQEVCGSTDAETMAGNGR